MLLGTIGVIESVDGPINIYAMTARPKYFRRFQCPDQHNTVKP